MSRHLKSMLRHSITRTIEETLKKCCGIKHLCRDRKKGQTVRKMSQHKQCSATQGIYVATFETYVATLTRRSQLNYVATFPKCVAT